MMSVAINNLKSSYEKCLRPDVLFRDWPDRMRRELSPVSMVTARERAAGPGRVSAITHKWVLFR